MLFHKYSVIIHLRRSPEFLIRISIAKYDGSSMSEIFVRD